MEFTINKGMENICISYYCVHISFLVRPSKLLEAFLLGSSNIATMQRSRLFA